MPRLRDKGQAVCSRCGGERTRRPDGWLHCRACKNAYLRLVQSAGLTRGQAQVANAILESLGREDAPDEYDPDEVLGCNDAAWVAARIAVLRRWMWRIRSHPGWNFAKQTYHA